MNKEERDRLRALANSATPGNWYWDDEKWELRTRVARSTEDGDWVTIVETDSGMKWQRLPALLSG